MSNLEDRLREKLSESAIILEANRDVGPRKYEIALNLFLDDAIAQIKQAFADEGEFTISNITFEDANKYTLIFTKPKDKET